jgi:uncharacterized protein (DUF885 family)
MFNEQGNPITTPPEGEEKKAEEKESLEDRMNVKFSAMEKKNTALGAKIEEQNETIQSQQEALNVRSPQQTQQQTQQGAALTSEQKEAYEEQFGDMPFNQIVAMQGLMNSVVQNANKSRDEKDVARDLRETQREIRSIDTRFKYVEADVNKRFALLSPEQRNANVYINLIRQVKEEKLESIIDSEVKERMKTNKGTPPIGEPKIGDSGNGSNFQEGDANTVKLTPAQIRQCVKGGIDPKKAEERFNKDLREG